jgi:hypothetical protein
MTYGEIMTTILSEVTGRPRSTFEPALKAARAMSPDHRLNMELSPDEAQKLLADLRKEKAGILNWLIEGRRAAMSRK